MLKITMIGNLGSDAKLVTIENKKFIAFSVAEANVSDDRQVQWVKCSMTVKDDNPGILPFLTKGRQVYLDGVPQARAYTDQQGQVKSELKMFVHTIQLLGTKSASEEENLVE